MIVLPELCSRIGSGTLRVLSTKGDFLVSRGRPSGRGDKVKRAVAPSRPGSGQIRDFERPRRPGAQIRRWSSQRSPAARGGTHAQIETRLFGGIAGTAAR